MTTLAKAYLHRRWLIVSATAIGIVFLGVLWLIPSDDSRTKSEVDPEEPVQTSTLPQVTPSKVQHSANVKSPLSAESPDQNSAFSPERVIDNPDCSMLAGTGSANDTALVVLPTLTSTDFAVLNDDGLVFQDTLPPSPGRYHNFQLSKHSDGSVIVGLGDLRLNSEGFRPVHSPEPVRIYYGENLVYTSEKAWNYLVAPNGTSFVVHEPLAGGASRLVVRNIDSGTEQHIDLGTKFTPMDEYEYPYAMAYSLDAREVMIQPAHADAFGVGTYMFFSVGEGTIREVEVENSLSAWLTSSEEGYFVDHPTDIEPKDLGEVWRVSRRKFDFATGVTRDVWSRNIPLENFDGSIQLSDNGAWLALDAWNFEVIDTSTGNTAFSFPAVGSESEQLHRLTSVLGPDASAQELGRLSSRRLHGNKLMFLREFGQLSCSTKPGEEYDRKRYNECVLDHRQKGLYRSFYDVYDMNKIQQDSQPDFRVEVFRDSKCVKGTDSYRGLQNVEGKLTFLSGF